MLRFLEKEHAMQPVNDRPARMARVQVVTRDASGKNKLMELLVDLDRAVVVKQEHLAGKHSYIDSNYMQSVEKACLADVRVQEEIKKLALPTGASVIVEAWAYAPDGMNDMSERVTMVDTPHISRSSSTGKHEQSTQG